MLNYDSIYFRNMLNVGIGHVIEKKQFTKYDKIINYYEIIDVTCGCVYNFNGKITFISLNKQCGCSLAFDYTKDKQFMMINYKSFNELSKENNYILDVEKFIKDHEKFIGNLYFYDQSKGFYPVDDETCCLIKDSITDNKIFDNSILNKNSNIYQMYSEIRKTIIAQDEQIMQILTSLFKNQKVVNSTFNINLIGKLKENLMVYGPTGTGKTEILKRISEIYKVPIVIADATSLSETGFVGRNIQDMLNDLYLASNKNIELAEKGILVIDEFDKLSERDTTHSHVSKEGVQRSLLKLLDGSDYYLNNVKFNTSKLSVVALGAFTNITSGDDYSNITTKDFADYGIMRELMGRFSKLVAMNNLNEEDIKKILLESNFSPLNTYKQLFKSMDIDLSYDEDFIDYIAEQAINLNSGARSLKTIFDNLISNAMFKIFAGDYSSIQLINPQNGKDPYILTKKKQFNSI